ncbi:hypothetical protein GN958_ATG14114 [Phytophthora infestans]|uniref:Uncharacterized protein n=1 Tax=Phytophthora infestans TaxID=4787 RepID=A0A8S9UEC2_PHYIN|nr:hypothetical protein GN958_ATG14114 [Phytophthora infestans]
MEWMIVGESKRVVRYLMDALVPEPLRRTVKNEMARESNKPLLRDVVAITKWLRDSCEEYLRWEPPANPTDSSGTKQTRKKPGHYTTHRVKHCPRVVADKAEELLRQWRDKGTRKPTPWTTGSAGATSPVHSVKTLHFGDVSTDKGSACMAVVESVLELHDGLLYSGPDVNVVSRGLVDQLLRSDAVVNEARCTPQQLVTFDGSRFQVTQRTTFDNVQLRTTAGSPVLRHYRAWIFEEEKKKYVLVLSRPEMERLGYSVDVMLARARDIRT